MKEKILLIILTLLVFACSVEKKAQKAFNLGKYETAISLYKKTMARNPGKANYFIAESYRLSNRLKDAEPYLEKAGGKAFDKDSIQYYYAQALKANGKYDEARKQVEEIVARTTNEKMKDAANAEIKGLEYIKGLDEKPKYYRIKNLEALNTPSSEYSPVFLNNQLYFTSSRGNGKIYEATGTPYTDLYRIGSRGANVDPATLEPLSGGINEAIRNEGCITFSPDGKTMVFAKGNSEKKKEGMDVDLYLSRERNGVWTVPILAPGLNTQFKQSDSPKVQNTYGWDSTPAFSPDGRTIYFASNRLGGYGGTDIYSAQSDGRGRFSRVRNMGPEINTPGNEMFPYVSDDGKLYFASDTHPGYGELDLFVVKRANGKTTIENLGQPVNSSADDFGIFLFKPDRGFFTSNREGGKGDDDIYTFINEDPDLKVINYYLQGITYADKNGKREILPNTKVSMLDGKGDLMQDYVTGNDGKFLFRVYENEDYELVGETSGYLVKRESYTTKGKSVDPRTLKELLTNITFDTLIVLDKIDSTKIFALENIYYPFNKWNITPEAAKELDNLFQVLVDNPEIVIELSSHTDSVDDEEYNRVLSQRRAESAVNYLIKKGISPERMVPKGYGESRPIARNTNPDGTDNPVGRQKNRRTEFRILSIHAIAKPIDGGDSGDPEDEDKFFKER
jgi:outer membrane protein OmpA-like peptidoglycan-associated protein